MAASSTGNEALDDMIQSLKDDFDYIISGLEALSRHGTEANKSAMSIASDINVGLEQYVQAIASNMSKG